MAVFNEILTFGVVPGTVVGHQMNGSLNTLGAPTPGFSSTAYAYVGSKLSTLFLSDGSSSTAADTLLYANSFFNGTNVGRGRANETCARLRLNGTTSAVSSSYQLAVDPSTSSSANSVASLAIVHDVTGNGAHTFGSNASPAVTHTFQSGNQTTLRVTGNNGISGPAVVINSTDATSRNAQLIFSRQGTSNFSIINDVAGAGTNALSFFSNLGSATAAVVASAGTWTFGPGTAGLFHTFNEGVKCKTTSFGTTSYLPVSIDANSWTVSGTGTTRTIDTNIDYATNGAWHFIITVATDGTGAAQIFADVGYNSNLPGFYSANLNIAGFTAVTYSNNGGKIRISTTTTLSNTNFILQGMAIGRYSTMTGT